MAELTLESLIAAVRNAEYLDDVKRLIGPSDDEKRMSERRIKNMDSLFERANKEGWGSDPARWPYPQNETYAAISAEQAHFENLYC